MEWNDGLRTGISVVDAQHRQLLRMGRELDARLQEGAGEAQVEEVLEDLRLYALRHFAMEEKYMRECAYPGLEKQQAAHGGFASRCEELMARFREKGADRTLADEINRELMGWIEQHVSGMDQEFGRFWKTYRENGA